MRPLLQKGPTDVMSSTSKTHLNDLNHTNTNNNNYTNSKANGIMVNGNPKAKTESDIACDEIRDTFREYALQNPDLVNKRDLVKLLDPNDNWYLKRYYLAKGKKIPPTLDMLKKTMAWRNEIGIHISEDAMFPLEFYKIGALFPYETDKQGNLVLYLRIKYHRRIDEMVEVEEHFLLHTFEKIDRVTNGQGMTILFDCQDAGYANADIKFLHFLINCATEHAPVGLKWILVYKLPWYLNAFWNLVKKILPPYFATRVRFVDDDNITEFIDRQNLPDFMNGQCRRNYRWIPPGCPSIFKLANAHGITDAEINKILPQFQPLLDEAEDAMANANYDDPPDSVCKYVNNPETAPTLLSDLALCAIGLSSSADIMDRMPSSQVGDTMNQSSLLSMNAADNTYVIRLFPEGFIEFSYDAYNDVFHATVTLFNPSDKNSLAFKLMSNRPSNYSVKPARGVLSPNTSVTLSIVLINEHKASDKFLVIAQPLEGEVESISKAQFDSLWSTNITAPGDHAQSQQVTTHTAIKLGSYLRKIVTTPAIQTSVRNPQVYELVNTCRSLKRRQTLSLIFNVILLIIIFNIILNQ